MMAPWIVKIGSPALRRNIAKFLPDKNMQELRRIIETLAGHAREVYNTKKAALEKGDEAVMHQVGEGKDILSILSMRLKLLATFINID